jgi:hypothetical protein
MYTGYLIMVDNITDITLVLDPCISYERMKLDYVGNKSLSAYLESSKQDMYDYYETHYAGKHLALSWVADPGPTSPSLDLLAPSQSSQKDFTSCFQQKAKAAINELDEFFKLSQEYFGTCNPILW